MAQEKLADNLTNVSDAVWETVVEESGSPISFENIGDQFIGTFHGTSVIAPDGWDEKDYFNQHRFTDAEGNSRVLNGGFKLDQGFADIEPGSLVRITRVMDVPMKDGAKNDMKDYRIEVAKK
jgi:hypothetical protein